MSPSVSKRSVAPLCLYFFGAVLLAGCSASFEPNASQFESEQAETPIGAISGSVHGGQAPVTGAQLYLFAAGTTGYGAASTSLISSGGTGVTCNTSGTLSGDCYITTDQYGDFSFSSNDYVCTAGTQVYMVAVGGNPGLGGGPTTTATFTKGSSTITVANATGIAVGDTIAGTGVGGTVTAISGKTITLSQQTTAAGSNVSVNFAVPVNNTAIVQMAALGQCPSSGTMAQEVPSLVINEVTTVAFAYAVGAYAKDAYHIGAPGNALAQAGLANAVANANNIVGIGWGGALASVNGNANSVAPQSKINTLADILATCVNTTGPTSSGCSSLFSNAENASGTQPTDEATAIFNVVQNPTKSVAGLYGRYPSTPVFTPALAAAPSDWALPVVLTGVIGTASGMAIDAGGNVWISDSTKDAVVKISPQGATVSYTNGGNFGSMTGVAVNPVTGYTWVSDSTNNAVYILNSAGSLLTKITTGSLSKPAGIAFDRSGNGYVVNSGAYQIDEYSSAGALVQTLTYPSAEGYSTTIAVDYSGDVYTGAGSGKSGVGALLAGTPAGQFFTGAEAQGPIALDATSNTALTPAQYWTAANNIWTVSSSDALGHSYAFFTEGYTFGGMNTGAYIGESGGVDTNSNVTPDVTSPTSLAFDGAGSLWIANNTPFFSTSKTWVDTYPLSGFMVKGNTLTAMASVGLATSVPASVTTAPVGAYFAIPDGAGNVWVANADGSVSELLGIATPVVTPTVPGKFCTAP